VTWPGPNRRGPVEVLKPRSRRTVVTGPGPSRRGSVEVLNFTTSVTGPGVQADRARDELGPG
jgi:hypothetical protein